MARSAFTKLHEKLNNQAMDIYTHGGKEYPIPNGMPTSVNVQGKHFNVMYHSAIYAEPKKASRLRGVVHYAFRVIVIDPRQTIHAMKETLYHEMAHVQLKLWQQRSPILAKLTPAQTEEVCDLFAEAHYDLLLNNH